MGANHSSRVVQERQVIGQVEKKNVSQKFSCNSEKAFLLMKKQGCVPDLPGHRMPPVFTMKSLKIEPPLNQLKQTQCTVLLKVCARSSVGACPQLGSFSLKLALLVSNL